MKIKIEYQDHEYFRKLVFLLSALPPFNSLAERDLLVYAGILEQNHKYRTIPLKDRNKIVFSSDGRELLASKAGVQLSRIYNIMTKLKKAGIIDEEGLKPQYALFKVSEITFLFINNE